MRTGIKIALTLRDRKALEALIANRNTPSKVVWRAQIILATAEGCGTNEIMRRSGKSKTCVCRWQERFMNEGVAGLTRDKTRLEVSAVALNAAWPATLFEPENLGEAGPVPGRLNRIGP